MSTSLPTIDALGTREALHRLAQLTEALLPTPGERPSFDSQLLGELLQTLGLEGTEPSDLGEKQRATALKLIADEIMERGKHEFRLDDARKRLGTAGRLAPQNYRIAFADKFSQPGVTKANAEDAIRNAIQVQHFNPTADRTGDGPLDDVSLFVREVATTSTRPFVVLVVAMRKADKLTVHEAWRVYPALVDLSEAKDPVDFLRAFANHYGFPVVVGNRAPALFIEHDTVPLLGNKAPLVQALTGQSKSPFALTAMVRNSTLGVAEVALAYCIDITRYEADLRTMGHR